MPFASSSRSNTSLRASRNVLIAFNPTASRHTADSPSASILKTFYLPGDVNLDTAVRHRIHIGRSSGRNVVDCKCIRRQRQFSTFLVFLRCRHTGYTFLSAETTTQRHQPLSQRHWQIEDIVQGTRCLLIFGSVDSNVSILSSQWMNQTPRPRLRAHPRAPLGNPMNMTITICDFREDRTLLSLCT